MINTTIFSILLISLLITVYLFASGILAFHSGKENTFDLIPKATELAINAMNDAFLVLDDQLCYLKGNSAFFEIFPQAAEITKGTEITSIDIWPTELRNLKQLPEQNADLVFTLANAEGVRCFSASVNRIPARKNIVMGWVILIRDISDAAALMDKLKHIAYIDSLTGILTRRRFMETAEQEFIKSCRDKRPCSVIIFDLDHFKKINDTHGHIAGDEVLKTIAANTRKILRPYDLLARYGGEEFIIFTEIGENDAMQLAERMREEISIKTYGFADIPIRCTASFGVAVRSGDSKSLKAVIQNADIALYRAKSNGRNRVELYSDNELTSKIMQAVEDGFKGFQLYYQPIFSTKSSYCIGAESLLRWQPSNTEIIMPDSLIPILKKLGLMPKVEKWVLNTACLQCKKWIELFENPSFYIHINLSQELLTKGLLYGEVISAIERSGITADNVVLEFQEILEVAKFEEEATILHKLRQRNIRLAIDRFGGGYSPLNTFKNTFVDELRIDRSFISNIEHDSASRKLLESIIHMGKSLDRQICALGVETDWQKRFLQNQSVDKFQGYLLGEPVGYFEFQEKYMK